MGEDGGALLCKDTVPENVVRMIVSVEQKQSSNAELTYSTHDLAGGLVMEP